MEDLVVAILCMLLVFLLVPLLWWRRHQISRSPDDPILRERHDPQVARAEGVVRRGGAGRMRRRSVASSSVATTSAQETVVESDEEPHVDDYLVDKELSKKEKKRQEREEQRQAEEAARENRRSKQDRYEERRRKKDEEREEKERLLEEEALARKAKEEEAAALEFEKWKGAFSVDAEGTTENELQDGAHGLLADFVEYIKKQKCVPLEELAAEFKLRTQDCINRITSLEDMGRLSGVMDDRGKYIYISPEEMKAVADYIKRQGRVSISHLASKSNQFIDLEQRTEFDSEQNPDAIKVA
ncbi:LOW QUALITY PROTEIN: DDRGK domain-containing protein 1 [Dioscorea cayenensis subsp. rotundata]|uniref:DDRGK domain-containing protein 1 n=1 Tax=Dioscorea cayennensis subsp. rotundata TaxID=55577 RepID=A0AB40BYX6_DIOCR|nr:LOW QUALITY PROTEIN: DDRGK domain-containing protein 1 [Dioscorea cayenensis subsp. rotundata]